MSPYMSPARDLAAVRSESRPHGLVTLLVGTEANKGSERREPASRQHSTKQRRRDDECQSGLLIEHVGNHRPAERTDCGYRDCVDVEAPRSSASMVLVQNSPHRGQVTIAGAYRGCGPCV